MSLAVLFSFLFKDSIFTSVAGFQKLVKVSLYYYYLSKKGLARLYTWLKGVMKGITKISYHILQKGNARYQPNIKKKQTNPKRLIAKYTKTESVTPKIHKIRNGLNKINLIHQTYLWHHFHLSKMFT